MADARDEISLTDVALRLKDAIEDKSVQGLEELFHPEAQISVDGRFYKVKEVTTAGDRLFSLVDQTYFDLVSVERVEPDDKGPLLEFAVDIAWVDKETWVEHIQKRRITLELVREPKSRRLLIRGLTAVTRFEPQVPPFGGEDRLPDDLDRDRERGRGFDPFSIWY